MKKKLVVLTALVASLFSIAKVKASKCSDEELANINYEASAIKFNYDIKSKTVPTSNPEYSDIGTREEEDSIDYYNVTFTNLTDNLYIKVTNEKDDSTKVFYGTDANNGVVSYDVEDTSSIANLTYKVYTSANTSCPNEEVSIGYGTLPMKNVYYNEGPCLENSSSSICKEYVTTEVTREEYEEFAEKEHEKTVQEINKDIDKAEKNNVNNFIKENKKAIIIAGSIIIVIGVVTTTVVIKKRRSRLI